VSDLHDLSALDQARLLAAGELTSAELVDHYLARIEAHDAAVGAFVTVTADAAREQAAAADARRRSGDDVPPLLGVPVAVKDLNLTAGVPTKLGSRAFEDFVPPVDDHVVTLMRSAGLVSLGKTNTPELGAPCYTEPDVAPPARTPWDLSRSAGGSSGGAGAAVAAGLVPWAQGSDGGGSIRIPASVCGLVGLKVSRGRISNGPVSGDISGLPWNGPIGRSVRDVAALLDVLAVPMPGDPHWAPPPDEPFRAAADRDPGRLVVGRCRTPVIDVPVDPDCVAAYEEASALLADLGHEVVDVGPPFSAELRPAFEVIWCTSVASVPVAPDREELLTPLTRWLRERGRALGATEFTGALAALQLASRAAIAATAHCDVVLTPTLAQPPRPVGWFRDDADPAGDFERQFAFTPFTAPYNMTGQPAITLPLHWSPQGLPIGVQLVGRPAAEATLLALSAQVEAARPWADRHPPSW
jgi:amidase